MVFAVLAVGDELAILVLLRFLPVDRKVQHIQRELVAGRHTGVSPVLRVAANAFVACARDLTVGAGARGRELQRVNRVRVVRQLAGLLAASVFVLAAKKEDGSGLILGDIEAVSERASPPLAALLLAFAHY